MNIQQQEMNWGDGRDQRRWSAHVTSGDSRVNGAMLYALSLLSRKYKQFERTLDSFVSRVKNDGHSQAVEPTAVSARVTTSLKARNFTMIQPSPAGLLIRIKRADYSGQIIHSMALTTTSISRLKRIIWHGVMREECVKINARFTRCTVVTRARH